MDLYFLRKGPMEQVDEVLMFKTNFFWNMVSCKLIKARYLEANKIHAFVNHYWMLSISQSSRVRKYSMEQCIRHYCIDTVSY